MPHAVPVHNRRAATRPPDPTCQACHGAQVEAVVRTPMAVYYRCQACHLVFGEPKPDASNTIREALQAANACWMKPSSTPRTTA